MNFPGIANSDVYIDVIENDLTKEKNISLSILRLDRIHPVISGNKIFKLYYFLIDAINSSHKKIITFGGAYSNHLAATAFACNQNGLKSIGMVRGEKPKALSHTLQFCLQQGMQLEFITRQDYSKKEEELFLESLVQRYGEHTLIPEGGFSEQGVMGAALIAEYINKEKYSHICCAAGTATTFAGLVTISTKQQLVIGFSVLKDINEIKNRIEYLLIKDQYKNYLLVTDYHFGGYAKKTKELILFMNNFFTRHRVPLDFVYTAKLMFGVDDLIRKNYFLPYSKILCIHTGGLQGNFSLPAGVLNF